MSTNTGGRVYALEITYPEGSTKDGWEPQDWDPDGRLDNFRWPRDRKYLSRRGATNRANLFRSYGCEVDIVESEPVQWPNSLQQAKRRAKADVSRKNRAIQGLCRILEDLSKETNDESSHLWGQELGRR